VTHFVLVYDRPNGAIVLERQFADADVAEAMRVRFAEELKYKANPDIEVVLLGADSRETLLTTHARYFMTVGEIARSA
jgi:hypothetical protein